MSVFVSAALQSDTFASFICVQPAATFLEAVIKLQIEALVETSASVDHGYSDWSLTGITGVLRVFSDAFLKLLKPEGSTADAADSLEPHPRTVGVYNSHLLFLFQGLLLSIIVQAVDIGRIVLFEGCGSIALLLSLGGASL